MTIFQRCLFAIIAAHCHLNPRMFVSGVCTIQAGWGEWQPWSPCSVTCGSGPSSQIRRRKCHEFRIDAHWTTPDKFCPETHRFETRSCGDLGPCPAPLRKAKVCGNDNKIYLDCDSNDWPGLLNITKVIYGNDANEAVALNDCPENSWHEDCVPSKGKIAKNTNYAIRRCDFRESCVVPIHAGILGDTCRGRKKYMKVYYRCVLPQQGPSYTEVLCAGGLQRVLSCEAKTEGSRIHIQKVIYGNDASLEVTQRECPNHPWHKACVPREPLLSGQVEAVRNICEGKPKCTANHGVTLNWPGGDTCSGLTKMLKVIYSCY